MQPWSDASACRLLSFRKFWLQAGGGGKSGWRRVGGVVGGPISKRRHDRRRKTFHLATPLHSIVREEGFSSSINDKLQQTSTISCSKMNPPSSIYSLTDVPFWKSLQSDITLEIETTISLSRKLLLNLGGWIIGGHVPNATLQKRWSYVLLSRSKTSGVPKLSRTNGLGIVGRDIALLLCTSHIKRGAARQFGEDAIHFDSGEWHGRNKWRIYLIFLFLKAEMFDCTLAFAVFDNAGTYRSISKIVAAMKNSHSYSANTPSGAVTTNAMLNNVHVPQRTAANHRRECCKLYVFRCRNSSFTTALVVFKGTTVDTQVVVIVANILKSF